MILELHHKSKLRRTDGEGMGSETYLLILVFFTYSRQINDSIISIYPHFKDFSKIIVEKVL